MNKKIDFIDINKLQLMPENKRRGIDNKQVEKIKDNIQNSGYKDGFALTVTPKGNKYTVIDGNHRLIALRELKYNKKVPCVILENVEDKSALTLVINTANENGKKNTLFDYLDYIARVKDDYTQKEIGEKIGWNRSKVKQYSALLINIKVTQVLNIAKQHQKGRVTKEVTHVTFDFTEGWFRTVGIYDLNDDNQLKLMNWFIDNKCNVNKKKLNKKADELLLKQQAQKYLTNNLFKEADGSDILDNVSKGLYSNIKQIQKAVEKLNEQITEKEKIQILHKDAFDMLDDLPDNSVDAIITDPPYNVTDNDWDIFDTDEDFLKFIEQIIIKSKKVLKENYHFYLFAADRYMADIEMLFKKHDLLIQSRIIWVRKNMSMGRVTDKKFISHYEPIFHIGNKSLNFPNEWGEERFNVQEFAVPQSNFDDKKEHPTQKPYKLIKRLVELSTDIGDLVVDPFCGAGTTAKACDDLNRKCITSDTNENYIKIAKNRVYGVNQ